MKKIQRVSKFFKWIFILSCFVLPVLKIIFWIQAPLPIATAGHALIINDIPISINFLYPLSFTTKLLGFTVSLIPLTVNIFVLYFLIRLFHLYERYEIFSMKNVLYIKYIGMTLLIGQIVYPVYEALLSVTLTWHNPPGERMAVVSLSGMNIGILLAALLIILISWIMAEGHRLKEDQQYTI